MPTALDKGARYDFVLIPLREEDNETMMRQVLEGIQKYFHVSITPTIRLMDVYVMTRVKGRTPPKKSEEDAGGGAFGFASEWYEVKIPDDALPTRKAVEEAARSAMGNPELRQAMEMGQLVGMSAVSSSTDELCRALEDELHRPVINETELAGFYDFKLQGQAKSTGDFLRMMHDQLGLELTLRQRALNVTVIQLVQ